MTNKTAISDYLAKLGSRGGKTTASRMTKEQRVDRARKAALARHGKRIVQGGAR